MKKITFWITASVFCLALTSCKINEQQTVNRVAKEFLDNINANKFAKAKKLCTKESAASVDMLETFSKMTTEQKPVPVIENLVCRINGDKASCDYMENGEQKKIDLVKVKGKWLVEMKKETPDVNSNNDQQQQQMIEDSLRAVEQAQRDYNNQNQGNNYQDQAYNNMDNDTVTYFDIGITDMYEANGNVHVKFNISNRSDWNIKHFWLESYISSKTGKFIQKDELMFDGILKTQMLDNIDNVDAVLAKNKIDIEVKNIKAADIGEIFLLPVRIQLDQGSYEYSPIDLNIGNLTRYVKIRNDSSFSVNITF